MRTSYMRRFSEFERLGRKATDKESGDWIQE